MRTEPFAADRHLSGVLRLCAAEAWPSWADPDTVTRAATAPCTVSLVAVDGDDVLGFAHALTDGVTTAYLSILVTDVAYRGKGIGRALTEAAMIRCGLSRMDLLASEDSTGFYQGFEHRTLPGYRIYRPD